MNIIKIPGCSSFSSRGEHSISAIVLHDTEAKTARSTTAHFLDPKTNKSSHYLVDKDGKVYQFVEDADAAFHAGIYVNEFSLGIVIVNAEDANDDPYPEPQMTALFELVSELAGEYHIPINRIVGHCDIAIPRGSKTDPGKEFPWFDFLNTIGALLSQRNFT